MQQVQHIIGGIYAALIFYGLSWLLILLNFVRITSITVSTSVLILLIVPLFALYPDLDFSLGAKIKTYHSKKLDIDLNMLEGSPRYHRSVLTHSQILLVPFFFYLLFFSDNLILQYLLAGAILGLNSHLLLDLNPYKVPEELWGSQWKIFKYRLKVVFIHNITGVLKSWKFIKINLKHGRRWYYLNIFFGFIMFAILILQNVIFTTMNIQGNLFTWLWAYF